MCSGIVFYNRGTTTCRTSFSLSESRNRPLPARSGKGPDKHLVSFVAKNCHSIGAFIR